MNIFKPNTTNVSLEMQHKLEKHAKHLVNELQDNTDINSWTNFRKIVNDISLRASENIEESGLLIIQVIKHLEFKIKEQTLHSPVEEFQQLENNRISQMAIDLLLKTIIDNEYVPLPEDIQLEFNNILVNISQNYLKYENSLINNNKIVR